jgi:protein-disulfide isomerase
LEEYPSQVALVVRYATFHRNSKFAVKILEAARKQGKFWEALELLFLTQPKWASHQDPKPELIWDYLPQIDLDVAKMRSDLNDPKVDAIITQDTKDGQTLGVKGTPTFFVNGTPLLEFGPENLEILVEQEVQKIGEK